VSIAAKDIVPLSQVRARLTELAEEVHAGREKIITKNGEGYIALIDAARLDHYHRLEREHIHLTLLAEAAQGLDDVETGRVVSVADLRAQYRR
jgi:prevent-host-death family protein